MRAGLIGAAVLSGIAVLAPTAAAAPKRDCGPRSAHTIKRNRLVRVYRTEHGGYRACPRRGGKSTGIDHPDKLVLHGRYLSYSTQFCDRTGCWFFLDVLDVPDGEFPAGIGETPGTVTKIVATSHGEAALLATAPDGKRFVERVDFMGTTELDRGPDLRALTLRDRRLHWLSGGAERDAPAANWRRCGPSHGAHAIALSDRLRVYSVDRTPDDEEYRDYYACLRPGGRPLKLVRENTSPDDHAAGEVGGFALAGTIVGFIEENCYAGCDSTITVTDVGARRRVRSAGVSGYLDDVVVSPRGLAAALALHEPIEENAIVAFDSRGKTELDHGTALHDLALDGTTLSWFNGSEQRTAELVGP
jgi:hypothetical protein